MSVDFSFIVLLFKVLKTLKTKTKISTKSPPLSTQRKGWSTQKEEESVWLFYLYYYYYVVYNVLVQGELENKCDLLIKQKRLCA